MFSNYWTYSSLPSAKTLNIILKFLHIICKFLHDKKNWVKISIAKSITLSYLSTPQYSTSRSSGNKHSDNHHHQITLQACIKKVTNDWLSVRCNNQCCMMGIYEVSKIRIWERYLFLANNNDTMWFGERFFSLNAAKSGMLFKACLPRFHNPHHHNVHKFHAYCQKICVSWP